MKKKIVIRLIAIITIVALSTGLVALLGACNKSKTKSLADIFKSQQSPKELTGFKEEFTMPAGWELYINSATSTSSGASDSGYIPEIDGFVIQNTGTKALSVVRLGDDRVYFEGGMKGMLVPPNVGISELRIKDGYIVCKFNDGSAGAFDLEGRVVLSRTRFLGASTSNVNIDSVIKNLGGGMFAVSSTYDANKYASYTSIYRAQTEGDVTDRGELVCRVRNDKGNLSAITGFDGKYVTVTGDDESYIFVVPAHAQGEVQNLIASSNATVMDNGKDDYFSEITYLGGGKFFIHEDWTVAKTEDYKYYDGFDYYCYTRHIYTPDNDRLKEYTDNADKVFLYLTNNYYGSEKAGIDTSSYLNDGYTYASYALTIRDKVGYYDQFILDKNLNIVMSLTGNYGVTIKDQKKEKVGHFDLIMTSCDGYYYTPLMPSSINIFDKDGNRVGGNDRSAVTYQELSNNIIIAATPDPSNSKNTLYGAYDIYGKEVIPFKYTKLAAFRGPYTVGERKNDKGQNALYLIGIDGQEIALNTDMAVPFSDMATTKAGASIYKIGCYMFREENGKDANNKTQYLYGVKNLNPNVDESTIIPARMASGSMLYAPTSSPTDVFVFEKLTTQGGLVTYVVYRLV